METALMANVTRDEIYKKVKDVLVDALGVDEEEVTPQATLRGDLGAESIDFLDIVFRLEKAFATDPQILQIPRRDVPRGHLQQPGLRRRTARSPPRAWPS